MSAVCSVGRAAWIVWLGDNAAVRLSLGARLRFVCQLLKYKALVGFTYRFSSARENVMANWRLGDALYRAGCYEAALPHMAVVAEQLSQIPGMGPLALRTRGQQAAALFGLGRFRESVEIFDLVIAMKSEVPGMLADPELQELRLWDWVADAMALKVGALRQLDEVGEAEAANEILIDAFDQGTSTQQRWIVANALLERGRFARARGDAEAALAALEEALLRSPASESEKLACTHCMALFERGKVLEQTGRNDEAIAVYDELVSRFRSMDEPDVQDAVKDTLRLRAKLGARGASQAGA